MQQESRQVELVRALDEVEAVEVDRLRLSGEDAAPSATENRESPKSDQVGHLHRRSLEVEHTAPVDYRRLEHETLQRRAVLRADRCLQ